VEIEYRAWYLEENPAAPMAVRLEELAGIRAACERARLTGRAIVARLDQIEGFVTPPKPPRSKRERAAELGLRVVREP
jgi:hypothetical protein